MYLRCEIRGIDNRYYDTRIIRSEIENRNGVETQLITATTPNIDGEIPTRGTRTNISFYPPNQARRDYSVEMEDNQIQGDWATIRFWILGNNRIDLEKTELDVI